MFRRKSNMEFMGFNILDLAGDVISVIALVTLLYFFIKHNSPSTNDGSED